MTTAVHGTPHDGATPPTALLPKAERDALYGEVTMTLDCALDEITGSLKHGRGAPARHYRENAERAMRLLDDLGWGSDDDRDDDRSVFELTMPAGELAAYARSRLAEVEECLRENSTILTEALTGGDPWARHRAIIGATLEDDVATAREAIDHDLAVVSACRLILDQLAVTL